MEENKSDVVREPPTPDSARRPTSKLLQGVDEAKKYYERAHKAMTEDAKFARGQQWTRDEGDDRYVANIVQRHIQQRVASLYAKDPKFVARPKERLETMIWDGQVASVQGAIQSAMMNPADMQSAMLLQEYQAEMSRRQMAERLSKTLELVVKHYVSEQVYPFKKQMKRMVRRALTIGVAYLKLDYQRVMEMRPGAERQLADMTERLAHIERMLADNRDGTMTSEEAEADQLRSAISGLEQEAWQIVREGAVFEFPDPRRVIPDKRCLSLDGFIGCDWVAEEYYLTAEEIQEIYKVDVGKKAKKYTSDREGVYHDVADSDKEGSARVVEVYHKKDGVVYAICEGWPDFLQEPYTPNVYLERFFPWFTLMFNELEAAEPREIYPPSGVALMRDMQNEYNRSREGLREHRIANRPRMAAAGGMLDEKDRDKLENPEAHTIIELNALQPGQSIDDLLQPLKGNPIDPNLYEVAPVFQDVLRVVGSQEANLGGTSGGTATESAIAEGSRTTAMESAVDDLNEFLTEFARCLGQVLLSELSEETAKQIVGQGAVWPQLTRSEVADELALEIEAGSTGRPNRVQELDAMTRVMPFLIQIPGIKPDWLATQLLRRLDDNLDLTEGIEVGLPSITAMNAQKQPGTGDVESNPADQGGEGGDNAPTQDTTARPAGSGRPPMEPVRTAQDVRGALAAIPG